MNSPLVPRRRFGAALYAQRARGGAALTSISRRCDGWWSPDELLEVERGAVTLDDASVVSFCRLYELKGRGLSEVADFDVLVDRSDAPELLGTDAVPQRSEHAALLRICAIGEVVGLDPVALVSHPLVVESLDLDADAARDAVSELRSDRDALEAATELIEDRVAVPAVGLVLAETRHGVLLLVRRAGGTARPSPQPVPAAGPLRWFVSTPVAA